jgi:hypothetical protein
LGEIKQKGEKKLAKSNIVKLNADQNKTTLRKQKKQQKS